MGTDKDRGQAQAGAAGHNGGGVPGAPRTARLKAALRANLARRKAQARARANEGADEGADDGGGRDDTKPR